MDHFTNTTYTINQLLAYAESRGYTAEQNDLGTTARSGMPRRH
jgi:hypothetical protein